MAANDEGFEEWDEEFISKVLEVEELALSSAKPSQFPKPQLPIPLPLPPPPPPRTVTSTTVRTILHPPLPPPPSSSNAAYNSGVSFASNNVIAISYSPPRELSQRPSESEFFSGRLPPPDNLQELEIERLKKELERVSKQVNGLEQECTELRRERDKQDKQLKSVLSDAKKAEEKFLKTEISGRESEVLVGNCPGVSLNCQNTNTITEGAGQMKSKACQAIGVQTDHDGGSHSIDVKEGPNTVSFLQKNLQCIWSHSSSHRSRSFITKLLVTCTHDFCDLFGYLGLSMSTRTAESLERELSGSIASGSYINSFHSDKSTRISNLCSVLTKIRDGVIQVDTLLNILLDLCSTENVQQQQHQHLPSTENVLVIHKSLCILHAALAILSTMERRHGSRENIKVEGLPPDQITVDFNQSERQAFGAIYGIRKDAASKLTEKMMIDSTPLDSEGQWDYSNTLLSRVNFVHIFQKMCIIVLKSKYNHVQLEAVLIMNAILVRSNSFSEREEYGEPMVFEAVAHLLRKEADLCLQREAVRLLHLMLNCPKLLAKFCQSWKDLEKPVKATDGAKSSVFQVSHIILQGLADCIDRCGNDAQGINLRRNATHVLAFLASSGASGFTIVLNHKLTIGKKVEVNFLGLILRALASDIDAEASESKPSLDILKERTLFMREALILLNRHVSNPATSIDVLKVLSSNRDMVSLTVDVAARLSRECRQLRASDRSMNRIRQSEVTELARVFKRRVFTHLGESVSS